MGDPDIFDALMAEIRRRQLDMPEDSYTAKLLRAGPAKIGAKVLEEAMESILAAHESGEQGQTHLAKEAADTIYHLWVLLAARGVTLDDVRRELSSRTGVSGLEEKRRRGSAAASQTTAPGEDRHHP